MLRKATAADIAKVVNNMRPEDIKEIWQSAGKPVTDALADLDKCECVAFAVVKDGDPIAIFGARLLGGGEAMMFRFATTRWPEVVREVIKIGRRVMLPLFKQAGIKVLIAETTGESDTAWLRLFGAHSWQLVPRNGAAFKRFKLALAP